MAIPQRIEARAENLTPLSPEETWACKTSRTADASWPALSAAGAAGLIGTPGACICRGPSRDYGDPPCKDRGHLHCAPVRRRGAVYTLEGFTDVSYVVTEAAVATSETIARGELDFSLNFVGPLALAIDAGDPIRFWRVCIPAASNCSATKSVRRITDLKGKTLGIQGLGSTPHVFLTSMAAYVGLDPEKDIRWLITSPSVRAKELFIEGKVDAFLGFPPEPGELRARHIGHVVVNSSIDRPWSQYFCCMLAGNADFDSQQPGRHQACSARHSQSGGPLCHWNRNASPNRSSIAGSRPGTIMRCRL